MSITLSSMRSLAYEVAINGPRILWETINDFSLWRLIEYPWATRALRLRRGDVVVDIGSGTSSYPLMLTRRGVHVIIVELEERRVRWQREKRRATARPGDGELLPVVADATRLPFADDSLPRVAAVSSLEHIPDDEAAGRELGRALAPGGILALTLPFTSGGRQHFFKGIRPFRQVGRNAFVQEGKPGSFFRFYTEADIQRVYVVPADAEIAERSAFGRRLLNGAYHETRLTRYWRKLVIKDLLLALIVHPLEELLDRSDPLYVMLALVKRSRPRGDS